MLAMEMTFDVSKPPTLIPCSAAHPWNMAFMRSTCEVSNPNTSTYSSDEQSWNMNCMSVTAEVSRRSMCSNSVRFLHPANHARILAGRTLVKKSTILILCQGESLCHSFTPHPAQLMS